MSSSATSGGEDESSQPTPCGSGASNVSTSVGGGDFEVGQRVFCYHGDVMYEARITTIEPSENAAEDSSSLRYMVHYHGWNKSWDEWVPVERLELYNSANKEKAAMTREKKPKQGKFSGLGGGGGYFNRRFEDNDATGLSGSSLGLGAGAAGSNGGFGGFGSHSGGGVFSFGAFREPGKSDILLFFVSF